MRGMPSPVAVRMGLGLGWRMVRQALSGRKTGGRRGPRRGTGKWLLRLGGGRGCSGAARGAPSTCLPGLPPLLPLPGPPIGLRGPRRPPIFLRDKSACCPPPRTAGGRHGPRRGVAMAHRGQEPMNREDGGRGGAPEVTARVATCLDPIRLLARRQVLTEYGRTPCTCQGGSHAGAARTPHRCSSAVPAFLAGARGKARKPHVPVSGGPQRAGCLPARPKTRENPMYLSAPFPPP